MVTYFIYIFNIFIKLYFILFYFKGMQIQKHKTAFICIDL